MKAARAQYESTIADKSEIPQAVCAFVIFRSYEGLERALYEFGIRWYVKLGHKILPCLVKQELIEKQLYGKWLDVQKSVEP